MQHRVEGLQGKKVGPWSVSCSFLVAKPFKPQSTPTTLHQKEIGKELYVFNFDNSKKSYLLMKDNVLEVDREIQVILDKTKLYTLKIPVEIKVLHDQHCYTANTPSTPSVCLSDLLTFSTKEFLQLFRDFIMT